MTLPIMEFRNRTGERINLSTVDGRGDVSTAILRHVVDVGRWVWCRPCQSADCTHADRIRDALTAAGLGNEYGIDGVRCVGLPAIKHVTQYRAIQETIAVCWFENEARLRYHEADDGSGRRVMFGPGNPRKPTETTILSDANSAKECLVNALTEYCDYRQEGDRAGLRRDRKTRHFRTELLEISLMKCLNTSINRTSTSNTSAESGFEVLLLQPSRK